jgi:calnexin
MLTGNVHAEDVKEASPSVPDKLPTFTVSSHADALELHTVPT